MENVSDFVVSLVFVFKCVDVFFFSSCRFNRDRGNSNFDNGGRGPRTDGLQRNGPPRDGPPRGMSSGRGGPMGGNAFRR